MITDDAMKVHFGLRLPDRAADNAHCCNYPGVNQAWELWHLQCWSSNQNNTLKDASVKWMKLGCVVPAFPLGPDTPSSG